MLKGVLFLGLFGAMFFAKAQLVVGDTVPAFTALGNGQTVKLDSTLERVTIVLCWATWNPPAMELLQELKEQYSFINPLKKGMRIQNIDIIDVSIDTDERLYQINLKRENLPWSVHLADYKGWESPLINQLKITKVPTLLILDEHRKVIIVDPEPKQLRSILSNLKVNTRLSN